MVWSLARGGARVSPPLGRRCLPVLLPLLLLIGTGVLGLDFGQHWDERHYQIGPMTAAVRAERPLPGYYGYPSLDYWIIAAATLPDALAELGRGPGLGERVLDRVQSHAFLLRLRAVFLVASALAVLWVYLLVLVWRDSVPEALAAATILASSWEVAYHSRWVATDGILMQFGLLTVLLVVLAQRGTRPGPWLVGAAIVAGLGAGTKYPGALLVLPVAVGAWLAWRAERSAVGVAAGIAGLCALAFVTFILTTPALVLTPDVVLAGMRAEIRHYGSSGHYGHSVVPGIDHLWRMSRYFGTVFFSWYRPIAVVLALLAVAGAWRLRRDPRMAATLLSFPLVYAAYFASQRAMVVRNLLVLAPFLALLAAHGAAGLWNAPRLPRAVRTAVAAGLAAALLANGWWLWRAALSIRQRHTSVFARDALDYVRARPGTQFYLSPRVRAHFAVLGATTPANATDDPRQADEVLFYAREGESHYQDWWANRAWLTRRWFGPYEVNFSIYPTWWGDDRIVLMSGAVARRFGLPVVARTP